MLDVVLAPRILLDKEFQQRAGRIRVFRVIDGGEDRVGGKGRDLIKSASVGGRALRGVGDPLALGLLLIATECGASVWDLATVGEAC